MKVIITSHFIDKEGIYAGIRHEQSFTSFSRLLHYINKEYKIAKFEKRYIQMQTFLK